MDGITVVLCISLFPNDSDSILTRVMHELDALQTHHYLDQHHKLLLVVIQIR